MESSSVEITSMRRFFFSFFSVAGKGFLLKERFIPGTSRSELAHGFTVSHKFAAFARMPLGGISNDLWGGAVLLGPFDREINVSHK